MALESQIQKDIMEAMKAKDNVRLNAIRSIKSAILLAKTSGNGKELLDEDIIGIIQKLSKQHKESAQQYTDAGRNDLAENEMAEDSFLSRYLPKQLSQTEVEAKLKEIISQLGASSILDLGKVMSTATKALGGLADGKMIASIVKKLLLK